MKLNFKAFNLFFYRLSNSFFFAELNHLTSITSLEPSVTDWCICNKQLY